MILRCVDTTDTVNFTKDTNIKYSVSHYLGVFLFSL